MPIRLGPLELFIIFAIVLVLFGGRLARIGGDLGRGIREFRKGLKGDEAESAASEEQKPPTGGSPS